MMRLIMDTHKLTGVVAAFVLVAVTGVTSATDLRLVRFGPLGDAVSYTHLRAHET